MINPEDFTDDDFKAIGDLAPGLTLLDLPEGYVVLEGVVMFKCMDKDGHIAWVQRWTKGLHIVEVLGAATVMQKLNAQTAVSLYEPEGNDES